MLHTHLAMGLTPAAIAKGLTRSASTLSRELRRNGWTRPPTRRGEEMEQLFELGDIVYGAAHNLTFALNQDRLRGVLKDDVSCG